MMFLNKKMNCKFIILFLALFLVLHTDYTFSYPTQIIENPDGTKTFKYVIIGDVHDDNFKIDENVSYNEYVLDESIFCDSKLKVLEPVDSEVDVANKNIYNAKVEILKKKYDELVNYLDGLKDVLTIDEKELLLNNLPEIMPINLLENSELSEGRIYYDVDYNDVSIDDMKKIYKALLKIYDAVKTTAMPLTYHEHLGYDIYIYGYNIDFIRANIKSLKYALSREKIYKIDKSKLEVVRHNSKLDNNYYYDNDNGEKIRTDYKIKKVSDLMDNYYYNVEIETVKNIPIDIFDIKSELNANDKIVFNSDEYIVEKSAYKEGDELDGYYDVLELKDKSGKILNVYDYLYDGRVVENYIIKVYRNAIFEEGYEYFLNNYVGSERLEDDFADNIICKDNLFENIKNTNFYFNLIDFDEKGYVKGLFEIYEQYE